MLCLKMRLINLFLFLPFLSFAQNNGFNADSAYFYTKHLSVTIGPRPMGSANEQAALKWAAEKFASFGADSAYVMSFTEAKTNNGVINTNSGIAVGVFRGETDSTIVIGGHIDSSGREIPGANDDASGTACAIELARVWSQRSRHYTLVFTAFGGEEQGLIGSKYFTDNYRKIKDVVLMLQIDMAASDDRLIIFFETKDHQAPEWLVKDVFAIERKLGYASLQYPVNFFSLNNPLGGAGSDHQPFLEKNIPAIDFTAGVNNSAVHTPQDKFAFVDKSMLARSGKLVDGLLSKYQEDGIPAPRTERYLLWPAFGSRIFMPMWLVATLVILSLLFSGWAFMHSRNHRLQIPKAERVRFSGTKVLLIMILIAIFAQLGEAAIQTLKGLRYPWLAHINQYLIFAAIWALAGIWVAMQLSRIWRFSPDPYVYAKRALSILILFVLAIGIVSFRLTFHPALTLLLMSLAIFAPNPMFKLIIALLAPIPMFKLMFMEAYPFLTRNSINSGFNMDSFFDAFLYSAALTAILVIWYLPSMYFYSYILATITPFKDVFKRLRSPVFGSFIALIILGYGGYLYSFPAYNEMWQAGIRVNANYDMRTGENKLQLLGNEYFRNVKITSESLEKKYDNRIHKDELPISFRANWLQVAGYETVNSGEQDTVSVNWLLTTSKPWYRTMLKIQVDTLEISNVSSELGFVHQTNEVRFTWFAEPPDSLRVTASFAVRPGAKIIREVKATYPEMPVPIEVTAELADVTYRTTVVYRDTLESLVMRSTLK